MGCFSSKPEIAPIVPQTESEAAPQVADPVSQSLGDAQQAVGLIDGIYRLVSPAVLAAKNKKDEKDSLKRFLGPWWDQACELNTLQVPVLGKEDLEGYLKRTNGVLVPEGKCKAHSPWGYVLHALAIKPEDNILTWKFASGKAWDLVDSNLALDIRGESVLPLDKSLSCYSSEI